MSAQLRLRQAALALCREMHAQMGEPACADVDCDGVRRSDPCEDCLAQADVVLEALGQEGEMSDDKLSDEERVALAYFSLHPIERDAARNALFDRGFLRYDGEWLTNEAEDWPPKESPADR